MANLFYLSIMILGAFGVQASAWAECTYESVPKERLEKIKAKEKEIAERPLKMSVTDAKAFAVIKYCQKASFSNDAGNLYLDLKKEQSQQQLKSSMATKPGLVASSSQWVLVFNSMFKALKNPLVVKGAVGSATIALNTLVGTSCIMNLELMAKGYGHKEREEYFNEVFNVEMLQWELAEKQTSGCSETRKALVTMMRTTLDLTRSQLVGSSQVLELLPTVAGKGKLKTFGEIYPAAAEDGANNKHVVQDKAPVKKDPAVQTAEPKKKNTPASDEKEFAEADLAN